MQNHEKRRIYFNRHRFTHHDLLVLWAIDRMGYATPQDACLYLDERNIAAHLESVVQACVRLEEIAFIKPLQDDAGETAGDKVYVALTAEREELAELVRPVFAQLDATKPKG